MSSPTQCHKEPEGPIVLRIQGPLSTVPDGHYAAQWSSQTPVQAGPQDIVPARTPHVPPVTCGYIVSGVCADCVLIGRT